MTISPKKKNSNDCRIHHPAKPGSWDTGQTSVLKAKTKKLKPSRSHLIQYMVVPCPRQSQKASHFRSLELAISMDSNLEATFPSLVLKLSASGPQHRQCKGYTGHKLILENLTRLASDLSQRNDQTCPLPEGRSKTRQDSIVIAISFILSTKLKK